jgi:hypothetical protein
MLVMRNPFHICLDSEERNVQIWVLWNCVSNTLRTVPYKLSSCRSAITIDGLRISALRVVVCSLRGGETEDVGPLLQLLGIYRFKEITGQPEYHATRQTLNDEEEH